MFRFSIREILLLTVIVALGFGWWMHLRRVRGDLAQMRQQLAEQEKVIERERSLGRYLRIQVEKLNDEYRKTKFLPRQAILNPNEA